jgi:membrane protease YdiL (CAAX protease family)
MLLMAELVCLFVLIPLAFYFDLIPLPKFVPLLVVFIYALVLLLRSKTFSRKEFGMNGYHAWGGFTLRIAIAAVVIIASSYYLLPDKFLLMPREQPLIWAMIMIFYPVWSAFTQEVIYRSFFFHRYKVAIPNEKVLALVNGLLFGFLHIIFRNWVAVIGATLMGLLWSFSYLKHRSLLVVSIEHSIVGDLLYTFGLGYFFYVPDF